MGKSSLWACSSRHQRLASPEFARICSSSHWEALSDMSDFLGGQRTEVARAQLGVEHNIAYAGPVQFSHPVSGGGKHAFHLMIAAFLKCHPSPAFAQQLEGGGAGRRAVVFEQTASSESFNRIGRSAERRVGNARRAERG